MKLISILLASMILILQGCSQKFNAAENPYLYPQCRDNPEKMASKLGYSLRTALCNEKLESNFLVHFKDDKVQLYVYTTEINDEIINRLKQKGFEIDIILIKEAPNIIQGWLSVYKIPDIEKIEEVKAVTAPGYPVTR